jgi:hypothetical protein
VLIVSAWCTEGEGASSEQEDLDEKAASNLKSAIRPGSTPKDDRPVEERPDLLGNYHPVS